MAKIQARADAAQAAAEARGQSNMGKQRAVYR